MKKFIRSLYIKLFRPYEIIDRRLAYGHEADRLIKEEGYILGRQDDEDLLNENLYWVEKHNYITE